MTITFRACTTAVNGIAGGTSVALSTPAGTVNGDMMIAHICLQATGRTITPPAGWTQLSIAVAESDHTHRVYTHTASSEPGSRSFTISGAATAFTGMLSSYGGVANVHGTSNVDGLTVLAHPGPIVGSFTDGCWLEVSSSAASLLSIGWAPAAGMTERADVIGGLLILLNVNSCVDTQGPLSGAVNYQRSTTSLDLVAAINTLLILEPLITITAPIDQMRYFGPAGLFTDMGIMTASILGGMPGDGYSHAEGGAMIRNTLQSFQLNPDGSCC